MINSSTKQSKIPISFHGFFVFCFLPFFLCKNKQIRKINCCPNSRFSGSTCISHHDTHCDFGTNVLLSQPKPLDSYEACTLQTKFKKATQGWRTEGSKRHTRLWIRETNNISSCGIKHTILEKYRRRSHLWHHSCWCSSVQWVSKY